MTENLRRFTKAVYSFDAVVNRLPAAGWDAPSPCEGWVGRDVLEHQCAVLNGVAAMARSGAMARPTPSQDVDDPVAAWRLTRDEVLEALDQPGALQQPGPFWFDAPDIDGVIRIVAWDPVTHSWDLAKCADMDPALDPGLVEDVLTVIEPMVSMLVETSRTTEPVAVGANASVVDRYLALVGRDPAYTPS